MDASQRRLGKQISTCSCGGRLRPAVVWFGEALPEAELTAAFDAAAHCDLFCAMGTSNQGYPAARLPFAAHSHGAYVIEINPEPTALSEKVDLSIRKPAGIALPQLYEEFHAARVSKA